MSKSDDVAGVFDAIDTEAIAHEPVQQEVSENAAPEGGETEESTTAVEETNTQTQTSGEAETQETGTSEEGQAQQEATTTETSEPLKTETQTPAVDDNWKAGLPPPPAPYQGPQPEIDPETGQITNMSPAEYATYMRETTKAELRQEGYLQYVENAALDAAEKILPEIKTNPAVRTMVENARVASIINGQQIDAFEAAKQVREALGIGPQQIAQAKAEATQNAKASITVQKAAALETGSSQKGNAEGDKVTDLQKRIRRGDDEAFVELLNIWETDGKI
jgi:hypothetical protein